MLLVNLTCIGEKYATLIKNQEASAAIEIFFLELNEINTVVDLYRQGGNESLTQSSGTTYHKIL